LLALKTDNKTLDEFAFQYANAPLYMDRYEALEAAQGKQSEKAGASIILAALKDKYYGLREQAIRALNMKSDDIHNAALPILASLAQTDDNTLVRAAALNTLAKLKAPGNMDIFKQALKSESYAVQGAALNGISQLDAPQALQLAKGFEKDNSGALSQAIVGVYAESGTSAQWPFVYKQFTDADLNGKFGLIRSFAKMTGHVDNPADAQQGIETIKAVGIKYKVYTGVGPFVIGLLNNIKEQRTNLKDDASAKAAADAAKVVTDANSK
jgi:aminopeptidase N